MEESFDIRQKGGHWEAVDPVTKRVILTGDTYGELMQEISDFLDEQKAVTNQ